MPFAPEFDDVYIAIKSSVEAAGNPGQRPCFRLDESRPAGRITDRLLSELRSASLCIADVTGAKPNVMWELGFAMALNKPTIVVTQDGKSVPFDIKDMQSIEYDRARLSTTLGNPLRRSIDDTIARLETAAGQSQTLISKEDNRIGELLDEVAGLKEMVKEVVVAWKADGKGNPQADLGSLAGAWVDVETGSHVYVSMIRNELVAVYCFGSDKELTGIYFGLRRIGEYLFGRYQWVHSPVAGFTFLRPDGPNTLRGAWWSSEEAWWSSDEEVGGGRATSPQRAGISSIWVRQPLAQFPYWAKSCFAQIEKRGLEAFFAESAAEHKQ